MGFFFFFVFIRRKEFILLGKMKSLLAHLPGKGPLDTCQLPGASALRLASNLGSTGNAPRSPSLWEGEQVSMQFSPRPVSESSQGLSSTSFLLWCQ